jgi:6-pyruvoyltetrahydropterin/6-carboxytetrahydropterin synthase
MTDIMKTFEFHAGHRLPNHDGKCRRLHGHTYRVDVMVYGNVVETEGAPNQGMVMDFGVLKEIWQDFEKQLDHTTLLWDKDPILDALASSNGGHGMNLEELGIEVVPQPPTAEFIAHKLFDNFWGAVMAKVGEKEPVFVGAVRVWETPTSWALYDGRSYGVVTISQANAVTPEGALPN